MLMRSWALGAGLALIALALAGCTTLNSGGGEVAASFTQDELTAEGEGGGAFVCPPNANCPNEGGGGVGFVGPRYVGAYVTPELVDTRRRPRLTPPTRPNGVRPNQIDEQIICPGDERCPGGANGPYSGRLWRTPTDQVFCEPGNGCGIPVIEQRRQFGWFCQRNRNSGRPCAAAPYPGRVRRDQAASPAVEAERASPGIRSATQ